MSCGDPCYIGCAPACIKAYPCPKYEPCRPACLRGPTGPSSPYEPLVYFQAAMGATSVGLPTEVPFSVVTTNSGDAFDTANGVFVAPVLGFYHFSYAALLANFSATPQDVMASLTVNSVALTSTACTVAPGALKTLAGSAILQLLPDQSVALAIDGTGVTLQGPVVAGAPPYPTVLSGFSLF